MVASRTRALQPASSSGIGLTMNRRPAVQRMATWWRRSTSSPVTATRRSPSSSPSSSCTSSAPNGSARIAGHVARQGPHDGRVHDDRVASPTGRPRSTSTSPVVRSGASWPTARTPTWPPGKSSPRRCSDGRVVVVSPCRWATASWRPGSASTAAATASTSASSGPRRALCTSTPNGVASSRASRNDRRAMSTSVSSAARSPSVRWAMARSRSTSASDHQPRGAPDATVGGRGASLERATAPVKQ